MASLYERLTEEQKNMLNWAWLSSNPGANNILEANLDKVDWHIQKQFIF